jgi:phosphoglycolate phosphatase-like HAD superfamily hydrolase
VDDLPAVLAATNFVFQRHGIEPMTLDRFRAEFCLPFKGFYERFAPQIPLDQLESAFHGHIREARPVVEELPHARDFLVFCRQHQLRTFVLSAVHQDHYAAQIALNGFDAYIDRAYVGVWDKRAKIMELLQENQLDARETLFIGDMQHDVETARHGGVFACAVLTGYNRLEQLRASRPDLIVEHLGELRAILERGQFRLSSALNA